MGYWAKFTPTHYAPQERCSSASYTRSARTTRRPLRLRMLVDFFKVTHTSSALRNNTQRFTTALAGPYNALALADAQTRDVPMIRVATFDDVPTVAAASIRRASVESSGVHTNNPGVFCFLGNGFFTSDHRFRQRRFFSHVVASDFSSQRCPQRLSARTRQDGHIRPSNTSPERATSQTPPRRTQTTASQYQHGDLHFELDHGLRLRLQAVCRSSFVSR
jgi:hypothetical protein